MAKRVAIVQRVIVTIVCGVVSGAIGARVALWIHPPPSFAPWGDFESPLVLLIGGFVGVGMGVFLANACVGWVRRASSAAVPRTMKSQKAPQSRPATSRLFLPCLAMGALVAMTAFCVSLRVTAWESTNNWELELANHLTWIVWFAANVAAPYFAACGLFVLVRRSHGLTLLVMSALFVMAVLLLLVHLPGQYQQLSGGRPNGQPNGSYSLAATFLCVLQWGIVSVVGLGAIGCLMSRRNKQ